MKRFFRGAFALVYLFSQLMPHTAWAALQLTQGSYIRINTAPFQESGGSANPGDTVVIRADMTNVWDAISNVWLEYSFSNTTFTYSNPGAVSSLVDGSPANSNVPTSEFNPPADNTFPVATSIAPNAYAVVKDVRLLISASYPSTELVIGTRFYGDSYAGSNLSKVVYINTRPHITGAYFEKSDGSQTTSQVQWGNSESINLVVQVKDYNGCTNMDAGTVTADLSQLGLGASENLSYASCGGDGKTATFKKTSITTLSPLWTYTFPSSSFKATDENGNQNLENDTNTTFSNEDNKTAISLTVVSPAAPTVNLGSVSEQTIGWPSKVSTTITFSGTQNGQIKTSKGSDGSCSNGTTLFDWSASGSYVSGTSTWVTVPASLLTEWNNAITVCLKNSGWSIWSITTNVTKDTGIPTISSFLASPSNITTNSVTASFQCSENGTYRICMGTGCQTEIVSSTGLTANQTYSNVIQNASFLLGANQLTVFCQDAASNVASGTVTVTKIQPSPSMAGSTGSLVDTDSDYEWIDGRDFHITWDPAAANGFTSFESFRVYVLPSNVPFNASNHTALAIVPNQSATGTTLSSNVTTDSAGSALVSDGSYVAYVAILSNANNLGTPFSTAAATIHGDVVQNPSILSAQFTAADSMEVTTDTTLDTVLSSHSGGLFQFSVGWSTKTGSDIVSVQGKKIVVRIPTLSGISATGSNLTVSTGAIHSQAGGYNRAFSSGSLAIRDGQAPTVSGFSNTATTPFAPYFSGSIQVSYTFGEPMSPNGSTKLVFATNGWNATTSKELAITAPASLTSWAHSLPVDLAALGLVSGGKYLLRMEGTDLAGNPLTSDSFAVNFDSVGPNAPSATDMTLISTLSPTFNWIAPLDDNGNGAGVASYKLYVYSGNSCSTGSVITSPSTTATSLALGTSLPANDSDYCWRLQATDKIGNAWALSNCDSFHVNTNVPGFSNAKITDTTTASTSYGKTGDSYTVSANVNNTDASHVWADISALTGNAGHTQVSCASPVSWTTCSYAGGIASYSFVGWYGWALTNGVRQVQLTATNTSGGNTGSTIASITIDNIAPTIANGAITSPNASTVWGGTSATINWNVSDISDNIGLSSIRLEYSSGGAYTLIWTWANNGSYTLDLSALPTGSNYQVRLTAIDGVGNSSSIVSSTFSVDKSSPVIASNAILSPAQNAFLSGGSTQTVTWNPGSISDSSLGSTPISLEYSLNNGGNWVLIGSGLANNGSKAFTFPAGTQSEQALIRITATDTWGNAATQNSQSFFIDSTKPNLGITYAWAGVGVPQNGRSINQSGIDFRLSPSDAHLETVSYKLADTVSGTSYSAGAFSAGDTWNVLCTDSGLTSSALNCANTSTGISFWSAIVNGKSYVLTIRARDRSGNEMSTPLSYVWDTVAPTLNVTGLSHPAYFSGSQRISGTASDAGAGINSVVLEITRTMSGTTQYFNGSTWQAGNHQLATDTSTSYANWSYDFTAPADEPNGTQYVFSAKAYDKAFKDNAITTVATGATIDTVGPAVWTGVFTLDTSSVRSGGTPYTISWNPSAIVATGASLGTTPIQLSYNSAGNITVLTAATENDGSYSVNLPSVDGNIRFILGATDQIGNVSNQELSSPLAVDSTPPSIDSIETRDFAAAGKVDGFIVHFSESVAFTGNVLSSFSVPSWTGATFASYASTEQGGKTVLELHLSSGYGNTGSLPTDIRYAGNTVSDPSGKDVLASQRNANLSSIVTDGAEPRVTGARWYANANGYLERMEIDWSETLAGAATGQADWTVSGIPNGAALQGITASGSKTVLNFGGQSVPDTDLSSATVSFSNAGSYKDAANNSAVSSPINGLSFPLAVADLAQPVIVSWKTEAAANGMVGVIRLDVSETLSGAISGLMLSGVSQSGTVIVTGKSITIGTQYLSDTGISPSVSLSGLSASDSAGNVLRSVANLSVTDGVAPYVLSRTTKDLNGNGRTDTVSIVFSEALSLNPALMHATVSGKSVSGYSVPCSGNANALCINLVEGAITETSSTPNVQLDHTPGAISDSVGNGVASETSATIASDGIGPVIASANYDAATHKVSVSYSESISGSVTPASFSFSNLWGGTVTSVTNATQNGADLQLSGETMTVWSSAISFASNLVSDGSSQKQSGFVYQKISGYVVLNEVLAENSAAQFVEIRNLSNGSISLSGWVLEQANGTSDYTLPSGTNIPANGYLLIAKSSSPFSGATVLTDASMDLTTGASNLVLKNDSGILFDQLQKNPYATGSTGKSMERVSTVGNWLLSASWYTAQTNVWFAGWYAAYKGTPGYANVYDTTAPSVTSSGLTHLSILPNWTGSIAYSFSESGSAISWLASNPVSSAILERYSSGSYSATGTLQTGSVSQAGANYSFSGLPFGLYRIKLTIADNAGNATLHTTSFAIDAPAVRLDKATAPLGTLQPGATAWTGTVSVTVTTIGVPTSLSLGGSWMLSAGSLQIGAWNTWTDTGFWFDTQKNTPFGVTTWTNGARSIPGNIDSTSQDYPTDSVLKTYQYDIRFVAKIDSNQPAGIYGANVPVTATFTYGP